MDYSLCRSAATLGGGGGAPINSGHLVTYGEWCPSANAWTTPRPQTPATLGGGGGGLFHFTPATYGGWHPCKWVQDRHTRRRGTVAMVCGSVTRLHVDHSTGGGSTRQALERAEPQGGLAKPRKLPPPRWSPPCAIAAPPRWPGRAGARHLTSQLLQLQLGRPPGCVLAQGGPPPWFHPTPQ